MMQVAGEPSSCDCIPQNGTVGASDPVLIIDGKTWTDAENGSSLKENRPTGPISQGQLNSKILRQIEFYFSDANILKDRYLLNVVKSNKEGWVEISKLATFNRVSNLSKDEEVIRNALKSSTKLEVSKDGCSVRRKAPIPEWDKTVYARSVLMSRFTASHVVTINHITQFFKSHDLDVKLVRIFDAGKSIPPDLTKTATVIGFLGKEKCAVVEFNSKEAAETALTLTNIGWPKSYSTICQLKKKGKKDPTKIKPTDYVPISLTTKYSGVKVELCREPIAPPDETSVGFAANWRSELRLRRITVQDDVEDFQPSTPVRSITNRSIKQPDTEQFYTPIAQSPREPAATPQAPAAPRQHLISFDPAIAFMTPENSSASTSS